MRTWRRRAVGIDTGPLRIWNSRVYLLDTNVISELRRPRPHGAVLAWVSGIPQELLFLSAVTIGELQAGIEITREQGETRAEELQEWLGRILSYYLVLPMDSTEFREWARLMRGQPAALSEDAMIAATAIVHGLTVVTRNVSDFARFGVEILNPFETGRPSA